MVKELYRCPNRDWKLNIEDDDARVEGGCQWHQIRRRTKNITDIEIDRIDVSKIQCRVGASCCPRRALIVDFDCLIVASFSKAFTMHRKITYFLQWRSHRQGRFAIAPPPGPRHYIVFLIPLFLLFDL